MAFAADNVRLPVRHGLYLWDIRIWLAYFLGSTVAVGDVSAAGLLDLFIAVFFRHSVATELGADTDGRGVCRAGRNVALRNGCEFHTRIQEHRGRVADGGLDVYRAGDDRAARFTIRAYQEVFWQVLTPLPYN